jgi:hypothetical protein
MFQINLVLRLKIVLFFICIIKQINHTIIQFVFGVRKIQKEVIAKLILIPKI